MYANHTPADEFRGEDNPHEPTHVPDGMEDDVHRVFEHVESWSIHAGHVKYVYPKTETGHDDFAYMLDVMGFEPGAIVEYHGRDDEPTRMIVQSRDDATVQWGEPHRVDDAAVTVQLWGGPEDYDGERRRYTPGDGHSVKNLWKAFIYGALERVGHVTD